MLSARCIRLSELVSGKVTGGNVWYEFPAEVCRGDVQCCSPAKVSVGNVVFSGEGVWVTCPVLSSHKMPCWSWPVLFSSSVFPGNMSGEMPSVVYQLERLLVMSSTG